MTAQAKREVKRRMKELKLAAEGKLHQKRQEMDKAKVRTVMGACFRTRGGTVC